MSQLPQAPRLCLNAAGVYEVRWSDNGRSKRQSCSTKDHATAADFFAKWLHTAGRDEAAIPSVGLVLDCYLAEQSQHERQRIAAKHLVAHLGRIMIDKLTPAVIDGYQRARPVSSPTLRRELGVLVAAINHAKKHRRIGAADVPFIQLPDGGEARTQTFSAAQVDTLLRLSEPLGRIHLFVWLASETASRRDAIEKLRWSQVDLVNRVIHFADGKSRTVKRRVSVPISDRLLATLQAASLCRISEFVLGTDKPTYSAWNALMRKAVKHTGDSSFSDMVPHDLRRTWATLAAQAGVSIWDIAGVLGDSMEVVTKHYAHHSPHHLRSAINFRATA